MYIDDKRYTWGYIIVLAVIIILCLIGGLFGEAKAAGHTYSYERSGNPGIEVNCYNGMNSYCLYQYDSYCDDQGRHINRKYVECGQCGAKLTQSTTVGTHAFTEWKTYGIDVQCYKQYRDCDCGYRETRDINHEESDWSAWKYICYVENGHQDYYERYITKDGFTTTDRKYVDHVHNYTVARKGAYCAGEDIYLSYADEYTCSKCGDIETKYTRVPDSDKTAWKFEKLESNGMEKWSRTDKTFGVAKEYQYRKHVEEKKVKEFYEKYYDEETGISYFESNVTSEYYYRALTEDGYIYAASFEELFVTIFDEEYDPLYFEEYFPYALTIETGIYVCPEV